MKFSKTKKRPAGAASCFVEMEGIAPSSREKNIMFLRSVVHLSPPAGGFKDRVYEVNRNARFRVRSLRQIQDGICQRLKK